jgi:hypothetical protein
LKNIRIGQSATKPQKEEGSSTIPRGSTSFLDGSAGILNEKFWTKNEKLIKENFIIYRNSNKGGNIL